MDEFQAKLAHLLHCQGVTWKTVFMILKQDPTLDNLYASSFSNLLQTLPTQTRESILKDLQSHSLRSQISQYANNDIQLISVFDPYYPLLLKETYQPPWLLYAKGNIELLKQEPKLAVVGSRLASGYGRQAIEAIFPGLVRNGIIIVSGLASGIDTLAHEVSIQQGGSTIAVIAGGLYHIYPKTNLPLALTMMKSQLVLSEYPPHQLPERWHFPMRNRIISGMCRGTFIIEAKGKSGSLITANYAVQEGRDVFALPGSIFSQGSVGTNELIQQGAKLVKNADDILDELFYLSVKKH